MNKVFLNRLLENARIDFSHTFSWGDTGYICLSDVKEAIEAGSLGTDIPFGDTFKHRPESLRDREYHLNRIVYFVNHPEEIKGLEVDNECDGMEILPIATIVDGWHRLMAAMYLRLEVVKINYGGRMDLLRYLQGKRKTMPE